MHKKKRKKKESVFIPLRRDKWNADSPVGEQVYADDADLPREINHRFSVAISQGSPRFGNNFFLIFSLWSLCSLW